MCSQMNKKEVSVMSWCSQWRLRLMWVVLDPVQTLLVDFRYVRHPFSQSTQHTHSLYAAISTTNVTELEIELTKIVQGSKAVLGIQFEVCSTDKLLLIDVLLCTCIHRRQMCATINYYHTCTRLKIGSRRKYSCATPADQLT